MGGSYCVNKWELSLRDPLASMSEQQGPTPTDPSPVLPWLTPCT